MRKFRFFLLFVSLLTLCLPIGAVRAQGASPVESVSADYVFGDHITITGQVRPGVEYDAISLHMEFPGDVFTLTALLEPDADGRFTYTHLIADRFVQAFSDVTYRFVLTRTGSVLATSEDFTFFYADNRFTWQTLDSAPFHLHWYEGDPGYAQQIIDAAQDGLARAGEALAVDRIDPVDVYVYADLADYQFSRGQLGQIWAGGHADPAAGLVIVSLPPGPEAQIEIERKMPHEVAHLALYQASRNGYWNLPLWLNEGFASLMETFPNPDYDFLVASAFEAGTEFRLADLCESFPSDSSGALQAYAESTSAVRYIQTRYGPAGLQALVSAYAGGASCEQGSLVPPIGLSLDDLDGAWKAGVIAERAPAPVPAADAVRTALPLLLLMAAVLVAPGLVLLGSGLKRAAGRG